MSNLVDVKSYGDYEIQVRAETDLELWNPRDSIFNLGTMVCYHPRYNIGDKEFLDADLEFKEILGLPIYLYEHDGIKISTEPLSCPLDSSQVGWIYVTRKKARDSFGWRKLSEKREAVVYDALKAEVDEYNSFLSGDVYYCDIVNAAQEVIFSIGGFIGNYEEIFDEAEAYIRVQARFW